MLRNRATLGLLHHLSWASDDVQVYGPATTLLHALRRVDDGGAVGAEDVRCFEDTAAESLYASESGRAEWAKLQEEAAPGSTASTASPAASSQQGSRAAAPSSSSSSSSSSAGGLKGGFRFFGFGGGASAAADGSGDEGEEANQLAEREAADDWQGGGGDGDGSGSGGGDSRGAALLRMVTGWDLHPDVRRRAMEAAAVAAGVSSVAVAESVPSAEEKEGGGGGSLFLSPLSTDAWEGSRAAIFGDAPPLGALDRSLSVAGRVGFLSTATAALCGAAWGALRRWRLWSSSGEAALVQQMVQQVRQQQQQQQQSQSPSPSGTASQGSSRSSQSHLLRRFALSSVLFRAALANACGAAALSALYGVSGVRFELWRGADWAHDSGRGAPYHAALGAGRIAFDLAVLAAVLRAAPYSLGPAVAVALSY